MHTMEKKFSKFINGTCTPDEFSEVLEFLCVQEYNDKAAPAMLKLWDDTLNENTIDMTNSQLLEKIRYRIEMEESKVTTRRITLYKNILKIAAVLILGLITSVIALYNKPQKEHFSFISQTVSTPFGARTSFKLPDGSEVWMNSGSILTYPNLFGNSRKVELQGEAYFKVIKNGIPFVVKTDKGNIEVTGTSFNVKVYPNESFQTTLEEGSVIIRDGTNRAEKLKPGQQAVITSSDKFFLREVNTKVFTSWKEGKLIFEKEPFQDVARKLERWYNVKIDLEGEKLKRLGFTGTIEMESFSEVLELIKSTVPIKYKFDKKTRVLQISGQ